MSRIDAWETAFIAAVEQGLQSHFEWSVNDCVSFAFGVRLAITGQDAAAAWRGQYSTLKGGLRVMRRLGWQGYEALARGILGEPLPAVLLAQRGDIVLAGDPLGFAVVTGRNAVGMQPDGPAQLPLRDCALAWRV